MKNFPKRAAVLGLVLLLGLILVGCGPANTTPRDLSQPPDLAALVSMEGFSRRPSWSPDGSEIVFDYASLQNPHALYRVSVPDGRLVEIVRGEAAEVRNPAWSPQGELIAFRKRPLRESEGRRGIYVVHPTGQEETWITEGLWDLVWSPDGQWIAFSWDSVYVVHPDGTSRTLLTTRPMTVVHPLYSPPFSWSPDSSKIAFASEYNGNQEVYVVPVAGSGEVNLTANPANDHSPAWSPDGSKIAFVSDRDGEKDIFVMNTDGSGQVNLTRTGGWGWHPAWSPDSRQITFTGDGGNLNVMNADGSHRAVLVELSGCIIREHAWSPDGKWIAFTCTYPGKHGAVASWIYLVRTNP